MCIIVVKKKGVDVPDYQTLKNCWDNNPDGAGLMYVTSKKKVKIEKGFMSFDKFYNRIKKLGEVFDLKNKSLVLHFRIGTSGGINKQKTHPFPISNNQDELDALNITCDLAITHNGVMSDYVYKNSDASDTQNFIKDYLYYFYKLNNKFYNIDGIKRIIDEECCGRLALLDNDDEIVTIGDFIESDGVLYSNSNYTKKEYNFSYYNNNSYYYDDYYYDDYYYDDKKIEYDFKYDYKFKKDLTELKEGDTIILSNGYDYKITLDDVFVLDDAGNFYEIKNIYNDNLYKLEIIDNECYLLDEVLV